MSEKTGDENPQANKINKNKTKKETIKQWIVLFRKKLSYNCDGVSIQIELRALGLFSYLYISLKS